MVFSSDRKIFKINERLDLLPYRVDKIIAKLLSIETDNIRSKHAFKDFFAPRTNAEGFGTWPGYMPKYTNLSVRPDFFYHLRQKGEMIILDKDYGAFNIFQFHKQSLRKFLIYVFIHNPMIFFKYRPGISHK